MTRTKNMELHEEDLQAVGEYVQAHLGEWLQKTETGKAAETLWERDVAVRESLARLETELKGQRELLHRHMDQTEKRFEQMDKRFEDMLHYMDKRFEQVDKRFEQVDKRFEQADKRFESVEKRLISIETSLRRFIYSSFSFTAVVGGLIIAVIKLA